MSSPATAWLERHQIPCYLAGLAAGAVVGTAWPTGGRLWEAAIYPVLGTLLYATFLQVPFTRLIAAFRDVRFLTAVLAINFVVVPVVVAALTLPLTLSRAVLLGVLLTLLTPCIDYVIVFCGLAGGDHRRLLAAAPVLMLTQMVALPLLLWLFVGPELADIVDVGPFLEAFGVLIVVPLLLAWGTQTLAARHRSARLGRRRASSSRNYAARRTRRSASAAMSAAMVPLMTATLFVVVAGQFPKIGHQRDQVLTVVPIYAAFLLIMAVIGVALARAFRFGPGAGRALVFTGATRNSLVVLPLALALPDGYAITPVIVVTQTLVELLGMIVYVRLIPRLLPAPS